MSFLKDTSIGTRLTTALVAAFVIIIGSVGLFVLDQTRKNARDKASNIMKVQTSNIRDEINLMLEDSQDKTRVAMNMAEQYFKRQGNIELLDETATFQAVNQLTDKTSTVKVPRWKLGDRILQRDTYFVDNIKDMSVETATIFQKIPQGYLRISTNVTKTNGERAVGTYIPNGSEVIKTVESGETYYGRAYVVNAWYITAYMPLYVNGEIKGMLYVGVPEKDLERLRSNFKGKHYTYNSYPFLLTQDGKVLIHKDERLTGEDVSGEGFYQQINQKIEAGQEEGSVSYSRQGEKYMMYYFFHKATETIMGLEVAEANMYELARLMRNTVIAGTLIGIVIFVLLSVFIIRTVTHPLQSFLNRTEKITQGDLRVRFNDQRGDEIGALAKAMQGMTDNLEEMVKHIQESANQVLETSKQLSSNSQQVSQATNEQASSAEEVSSSIEHMKNGIKQNAQNAKSTEEIASNAQESLSVVKDTSQTGQTKAKEIDSRIQVITDIANQTNILALNAAVEAARAGKYGKGFAVVAAEVRKLAEQSNNAAKEIIKLSGENREMTNRAYGAIDELLPDMERTTRLVKEISEGTNEQEQNAEQMNSAVQEMSNVTQQNASSSEEMASNAEELSAQAEKLKKAVDFFKVQ